MKFFKKAVAVTTAGAMMITALPGGHSANIAAAAAVPEGLAAFSLDEVRLTDEYYLAAETSDIEFLCQFDTDRLLSRFRETAGIDTRGAKPYKGWENSRLGGHCVGHYLTAAAQAVKATDNQDLREKLDDMIVGLKECQDALGTGFIFGAQIDDKSNVEKQFDILENKAQGDTWVPWYNMHKVIWGLIDVYRDTDNDTALEILKNLGEWVYNRVSKWDNSTQKRVLSTEYGGMNDCMYELYAITGDERYSEAAHKFDEPDLYQVILSGKANTLSGRHANATIPKFLGALNRYKTMGDEDYLEYAEGFWDLVISKHSFATGGVSVMEHFRDDEALDATRTQCNCESCCVHNLLRISRDLFMITGDVKYADYYEKALRNAIMGAINTDNGTFSYFTPMATGYFKFFGEADPADNMYWCCTGTGMENYTKLGDSIYFHNDDSVIVNQYVASTLNWKEMGVNMVQDSDVTTKDTAAFTITIPDGQTKNFNLYLRVPEWISGSPHVTINGVTVNDLDILNGYVLIQKDWQTGDTVTIRYPMTIQALGLPDNDTVFAFRYGPTLLAAKLGTDYMDVTDPSNLTGAGVNLSAPLYKVVGSENCTLTIGYGNVVKQVLGSETLQINDMTLEQFMDNIADNMVKDESTSVPTFKLQGTDADDNFDGGLTFVPFNTLNDERYGIYWYFSAQTQEQLEATILANKEEGRLANSRIDSIQPGYEQYEKDTLHDLKESSSVSTVLNGESTRHAQAGGYFEYNMIVNAEKTNKVLCTYTKEDNGKTMKISVGNSVIATEKLNYTGDDELFNVSYEIPEDVITQNMRQLQIQTDDGQSKDVTVITVRFESDDSLDSARLVGGLYMTINYNNNACITDIKPDTGTLSASDDTYTISVPNGTQIVKANITIGDTFGLLYINDKLVNDGKIQTFTVNGENASYKLAAYAEDHTTSKQYTLNIVQEAPKSEIKPEPTAPVTSNTSPSTVQMPAQVPEQTITTDTSAATTASGKAKITISGKKTVKVGKTITLKAKLTNIKGTVKWSVNKKKIAKINSKTGKLKGLKPGKVKVTATVKKVKASVTIKVTKNKSKK